MSISNDEKLSINEYSELLFLWLGRQCGKVGSDNINKILKFYFIVFPPSRVFALSKELLPLDVCLITRAVKNVNNNPAITKAIIEDLMSKIKSRLFPKFERDPQFAETYASRLEGYLNFKGDFIGLTTMFLTNLYGKHKALDDPKKIFSLSVDFSALYKSLQMMIADTKIKSCPQKEPIIQADGATLKELQQQIHDTIFFFFDKKDLAESSSKILARQMFYKKLAESDDKSIRDAIEFVQTKASVIKNKDIEGNRDVHIEAMNIYMKLNAVMAKAAGMNPGPTLSFQ